MNQHVAGNINCPLRIIQNLIGAQSFAIKVGSPLETIFMQGWNIMCSYLSLVYSSYLFIKNHSITIRYEVTLLPTTAGQL